MTSPFKKTLGLIVAGAAVIAPLAVVAAPPAGFISLFDGKTLNGWHGDKTIWSVKDGVINGQSNVPVANTTFLVLDKNYPNFEMHLKYRFLTKAGNSGLQFRSGVIGDNYGMAGMQSNITPITPSIDRFGMLYDESSERQEMVLLGQKAVMTRGTTAGGGQGSIIRTVLGTVNPQQDILKSVKEAPEWNDDVFIVYGNHMVHAINGLLVFDALDKDPLGQKDGKIGFQFHHGPAFTVQFKDVYIKPLTSFPNIAGRFITHPGPAPTPAVTYKPSTQVNMPDKPMQ